MVKRTQKGRMGRPEKDVSDLKKDRLSFRIHPDMRAAIEHESREEVRTMSAWCELRLIEVLRERGHKLNNDGRLES